LKRKSKNHVHLCNLLKKAFPNIKIINEYKIKINNKLLYIDIFIPLFNFAIEINGKQHYEFNEFMHNSKADFIKQKFNDELKREYCQLKKIRLVVLKDTEFISEKELINLIKGE
jgi:hypothetical protein